MRNMMSMVAVAVVLSACVSTAQAVERDWINDGDPPNAAAGPAPPPVAFDWARVRNAGNAADPLNEGDIPGIGSVAYEYRIARHKVTNAQYAQFRNAVA